MKKLSCFVSACFIQRRKVMYSLNASISAAIIIFPMIAFIITIPYLIWHYHKYGSVLLFRAVILYSFILYLLCAFFLVILPLPSIAEVARLHKPSMQLIPFQFVSDIEMYTEFSVWTPSTYWDSFFNGAFLQVVFNILMFIPFGIYLRYYYQKNFLECFLLSLSLSLFFEITQLTGLYGIYPRAYRLFDVDDLMLNTVGGLLGFIIEPVLVFLLPTKDKLNELSYEKGMKVTTFRRMMGTGIDWFFIFTVLFLIEYFTKQIKIINIMLLASWKDAVIYFAIIMLYFMVLPYLLGGYTLGKRIVNIKVVNKKMKKPVFIQYFVRYGILYGIFIPVIPYIYQILILLENNRNTINTYIGFGLIAVLLIGSIFFGLFAFLSFFTNGKLFLYEKLSSTSVISVIQAFEERER